MIAKLNIMLLKINFIIFSLISIVLITTSCIGGNVMMINKILHKIDNSILKESVITIENSESRIIQLQLIGMKITQVNEISRIQCIRHVDDVYYVIYKGSKGWLYDFFDSKYNLVFSIYTPKLCFKSEFDNLTINSSTLDDVQKIDPSDRYIWLYTGSDKLPPLSTHYTLDGKIVEIKYRYIDSKYIIIDIVTSDATNDNWVAKILPIDYI